MVAYGFKPGFAAEIEVGRKRQTIRRPRKRHARPGEPVQLFVGMRTRACRKIIPDPICVGLDEVRIDLRSGDPLDCDVQVNGIPLEGAALDLYAESDGFTGISAPPAVRVIRPAEHMMRWWLLTRGASLFTGVAIRWEARP